MRKEMAAVAVLALLVTAACQDATQPTITDDARFSQTSSRAVPGQYIVVLTDDVRDVPGLARGLAAAAGGSVLQTYEHAIKGFAARLPEQAIAGLSRNPNVAYVEVDREAQLHSTQNNPPSWGLDRIDARSGLDHSYTYGTTGTGVNIYILDTGIRSTHSEFGGRAQFIPNGANGDFVGDGHGSAQDCHGHGTHVAGTAAGATYGVAKGANIWSGRVVNCSGSGTVSMAIAGVDWITASASLPAVVNMSLGYGNVQSLRDAVENSIASGVNYAVSAGNGNFAGIPQDACAESPAGAPDAMTVGATDSSDREASFSNYGTCVDIMAPGVSILSAYYSSDNATATMSGTSMASPHVTGSVALYLEANPTASPAAVAAALKGNATQGAITLHRRSRNGGTPNALLYTGFIGGGSGGNNPPAAAFTSSCADLTCAFTDQSTDSDGTVAAWNWDFGDGNVSNAENPSHTYGSGGAYTVTLTVTDNGGATDVASSNVTVTDPPSGSVTVTSINPSTVAVGSSVNVTISGSGFAAGASVSFLNGSGKTPTASNVSVADASTITLTVTVRTGGPRHNRVWDVRVTNPDASFGELAGGLTVTP